MTSRLEQRIFRDLLADKMSLEQAQKAMADPEAWKMQKRGMRYAGKANWNWRYWRWIDTPRLRVRFCWYTHRNTAGYFIGWRETTNRSGTVKRDQFVARRCRERLKALMKRKTEALEGVHPKPDRPKTVKRTPPPLDPRIERIEGSTGEWFIELKPGYLHCGLEAFYIDDRRTLSREMKYVNQVGE